MLLKFSLNQTVTLLLVFFLSVLLSNHFDNEFVYLKNHRVGSSIESLVIKAKDPDNGEGGTVTYRIEVGKSLYQISPLLWKDFMLNTLYDIHVACIIQVQATEYLGYSSDIDLLYIKDL